MAATTVGILVDLYNGAGAAVTQGTAEFTPQVSLRDVPDGMGITQSPVVAQFSASGLPVQAIIPTDAPGPQPSGWAWQVSFVNVPGNPVPFAFFAPAGPCPVTVTDASPAVFTWTPTSAFTAAAMTTMPNGTVITFATLTGAAGFTTATPYYVVASTGATFELSATRGGSPIASTSTGSGTFTVTQYNLSALSPLTSLTPLAAAMPLPSGTPTTGQVPVVSVVSPLALGWGAGGGGGISPPAGDIGGTAGSPTVVSTHLSAALPVNQGGTGQITQQAAMDSLAGTVTSGQVLRGNGTHVVMAGIQAGDLPAATTSAQGAVELDGTAGDIAALASAAAAGSTGKAADAGHAHPSTGVVLATQGGKETVSTNSTATGAVTLNLATANVFNDTLTGNVTYTFSGATSGVACSFTLYVTQDATGGRTVTWPGSVTWLSGTAPVVPSGPGAVSAYVFETLNGGTTWFGSAITGAPLPLAITQGGTGATTASAALAALGGAPLISPALAGTPTAPTQAAGDTSTLIATDAFVAGSPAWVTQAWQFRPEAYGALRNGRIVTDGAMSSTSNQHVLTCATSAPFTSASVGMYVLVWGAVTSTNSEPGYLFATITGYTSASQVTLSVPATITVSGVGVLFGNDDTAAIQDAVNAATTYSLEGNGALGQVLLSEGIYCSGAAATLGSGAGGGNASISLPIVNAEAGVKAQVQIVGAGCSQLPHWTQPQPPQGGSIIAAMNNTGSLNTTYGPTSIIGGPVNGYGGGGGTFSNMHIRLQGFTILVPMSSGAYCGPDLYGIGQASVDEVSYLPLAVISASTVWPALSTNAGGIYGTDTYWPAYSFGLRMPSDGNNAVADIGSFTSYFTQISLIGSEHTTFVNLRALFSQYGILAMTNTGGTVSHGITGLHYLAQQVDYPVGSVASGYYALDCAIGIVIARLDIESQTQIVNDAAGLLYGEIGFNLISAVTGYIAVQYAGGGGSTLKLKRIEAAPGPVTGPQAPPANNAAWPNYYYRDAWITLAATTITAVKIDSTAQAVPSAAATYSFFLPAGHSYTPTYTGTLTHTVSLL